MLKWSRGLVFIVVPAGDKCSVSGVKTYQKIRFIEQRNSILQKMIKSFQKAESEESEAF